MKVDKEYVQRVLKIGEFGGLMSTNEWYVIVQYDNFSIQLRPEEDHIDFWIQEQKVAYIAISLPHPDYKTAYVSNAIRWIFKKLLEELTANYTVV